jgi:hypothetical protein
MQLFILDYEPKISVEMLSDCHVIKMCLETSQILSSVMFNLGIKRELFLPKPYNPRHPVIMAINNEDKINWLLDYNKSLHNEYIYRFNKEHSYYKLINSYEIIRNKSLEKYDIKKLDFARDFKDFACNKSDLVESFREYYKYKKTIIKRWKYTKREEPNWLK